MIATTYNYFLGIPEPVWEFFGLLFAVGAVWRLLVTMPREHQQKKAARAAREKTEAERELQRQIAFEAADRLAVRLSRSTLAQEIDDIQGGGRDG
jgi:hypothetical protein